MITKELPLLPARKIIINKTFDANPVPISAFKIFILNLPFGAAKALLIILRVLKLRHFAVDHRVDHPQVEVEFDRYSLYHELH